MQMTKLEEFKSAIIKFGEVLSSKLPSEWTEGEIHQQLACFKLTYVTNSRNKLCGRLGILLFKFIFPNLILGYNRNK